MEKMTYGRYQKKAVLRCASFLPTEGPLLSKDDFIRAVIHSRSARQLS